MKGACPVQRGDNLYYRVRIIEKIISRTSWPEKLKYKLSLLKPWPSGEGWISQIGNQKL
jgi:hypothetical protein